MENLRNPMVSRAAAMEAAERLQQLAILLEDDGVLKRIVSEADRTIRQNINVVKSLGDVDVAERMFDAAGYRTRSKRLLS